jgi:hypothetical protein
MFRFASQMAGDAHSETFLLVVVICLGSAL